MRRWRPGPLSGSEALAASTNDPADEHARRVDLGEERDLFRNDRAVLTVDGVQILLLKVGRRVHAIVNVCPHLGQRLDTGRVTRNTLTCRGHGITYDLRSGRVRRSGGRVSRAVGALRMLPVERSEGHVFVIMRSPLHG